MSTLTKRQAEIIADNLMAFRNNFEYICIERADYGDGFYIYISEEDHINGDYIQYCYNIDYLNGWLYGCVQAVNKNMNRLSETEKHNRINKMIEEAGI